MQIPEVTAPVVEMLKRYAGTIYLTQTIEKREGRLTRFLNREDACGAWDKDPAPPEWRPHIDVPGRPKL